MEFDFSWKSQSQFPNAPIPHLTVTAKNTNNLQALQRIAIIQFISVWKSGCEDHKFIQVSLQKDTTDHDLTIWVP